MQNNVKYQSDRLRDYSSLFSRSEVQQWFKNDFSSLKTKIERYDNSWFHLKNANYLDYLKYIYSIISDNYQNEYVYKNEFLNNWLISELGESDSCVFSEFRVGNSVADLAMFNGSSKIFEIKTEYDCDFRLPLQIENYKRAFNKIFLIVPKSKLDIYKKYDKNIGIISFNSEKDNQFTLIRDAVFNSNIDVKVIMNILHTNEYRLIVDEVFGKQPNINSFNQFDICSDLIAKIPLNELNQLFISTIKKRKSNNILSARYYKEFNQLFLALRMNKKEKDKMIDILKRQIHS